MALYERMIIIRKKFYAIYKGDEFIDLGTAEELAIKMNTSKKTIQWYAGSNRWKNKKNKKKNSITVIVIEDD